MAALREEAAAGSEFPDQAVLDGALEELSAVLQPQAAAWLACAEASAGYPAPRTYWRCWPVKTR